jgi:TDG/mug DNA glycosylase family protein
MDKATVDAYESDEAARRYLEERSAYTPDRADAFAVRTSGWRVDLGSGPGHYGPHLGAPLVSLDASHAMLRLVEGHRVQADLAALPFRRGALGGAWSVKTYQHVPHETLPLALADLHRSLELGAPIVLDIVVGDGTMVMPDTDDFPGRLFALWTPDRIRAVVEGAGFEVEAVEVEQHSLIVTATRARMLPDLVRPGLRVLFCGYNPSLYAADAGVGFARPGNRFWPAALEAGVVTRDRDTWHAVRHHDVGFTDLVKRATVGAAELSKDELRTGLQRVTALCEWLAPEVICFLGVGGWRDLVDRKAALGWQPTRLGPTRVYVMPNPSGLNASTQHAGFVEHLRALMIELAPQR